MNASDERRGLRAVAVLGGLALAGGLLWTFLPRMLSAAGGPEPELLAQVRTAALSRAPMALSGTDVPFLPTLLQFDRVSVDVDGERATVVATLDARGRVGATEVSSLGRERLHFLRREGRWEREGALAPALTTALSALALRARLLGGGASEALSVLVDAPERQRVVEDPRLPPILGTPGHRWEPHAWYLRSEREGVVATEDALLVRPGRPSEPRSGRFLLQPSAEGGGRFVFMGGVL